MISKHLSVEVIQSVSEPGKNRSLEARVGSLSLKKTYYIEILYSSTFILGSPNATIYNNTNRFLVAEILTY